MTSYATPEQYAASPWSRDDTATARELALASLLVDAALEGAVYVTGTDGLPTDPRVRQALQDAVVATVDASRPDTTPEAPAGPLGAIPNLKAATIGGVRYELETAASQLQAGLAQVLPFAARQLLRNAGLDRGTVYVRG